MKFVPLNSSMEKYSKSLLDSLLVTILCSLFQELRYLTLFADKVCFVSPSISNDTKNRGIDASIYNYKKQSHSLDLRCDVTYLLHFLFSIFLKNNIPYRNFYNTKHTNGIKLTLTFYIPHSYIYHHTRKINPFAFCRIATYKHR